MAFCSKCGTEINDGVKFYPNCGTQLDGVNGTQRVSNSAQGEPKKKMALWKKIGIGFIIFAIIGALSQPKDGKTKSNDETNAPQKTEKVSDDSKKAQEEQARQAKEEEEERQAREQKEEEERQAREQQEKEARTDEILKEGYDRGYKDAMQYTYYQESNYRIAFTNLYGAPQSDEEIALYKQYKEQYNKGWDKGKEVKREMEN